MGKQVILAKKIFLISRMHSRKSILYIKENTLSDLRFIFLKNFLPLHILEIRKIFLVRIIYLSMGQRSYAENYSNFTLKIRAIGTIFFIARN